MFVDTNPRAPTSIVRDIQRQPTSRIVGINSLLYLTVFRITAAAKPSSVSQVNSKRMTHLILTDQMTISGRLSDAMISGGNVMGLLS